MTADIESVGFGKGELTVMFAGRQTGKSVYHQYAKAWDQVFKVAPKFEIIDKAIVDGEQWYTVRCTRDISAWVRTMKDCQWQEHIDRRGYIDLNIFDMDAKLYTMLGMKFS